jgi:excisionase family DNA binding protein
MMERTDSNILTRKEAAELLRLPARTLDYLVCTKQIPFSRIGKRNVRFSRKRLEEWFKERESIEYHRNTQRIA